MHAISLALFGLAPSAAFALGAQDCEQRVYSADFEIEVQSVRDLGQGFVMETSTGQGPRSGSQRIAFDHCASGQRIVAVAGSWNEQGTNQAPADPYTVVREALDSDTVYTIPDVALRLREQGIETDLFASNFQTCGCAVFYPEALGSKTAWSGQ